MSSPVQIDERLRRLAASLTPASDLQVPDERDRAAAGKRSRMAAVAALLRPTALGELELLFIRRAERAGDVWSGHIAFPGGRREHDDTSIVATAARETMEEVGIDLTSAGAVLLGALPVLEPQNPQLPPLTVFPLVWAVDADARAGLSDEVAAVRWVTIEHLRSVEQRTDFVLTTPDGVERRLPAIALGEDVLWGMTHHIVHTLLDVL
jgi:8-oxo-dGTP pyrophosphatase MutT (NUDIX family)